MSPFKDQTYLPCLDFNVHRRVSPDTAQQTSSTFRFMSLAGELRNQIYARSLASGTTAILLVSKSIYVEAKPILYKVGILKLGKDGMYFGSKLDDWDWKIYPRGIPPVPSEKELALIQNVTIDIDRTLLYRTFLNDTKLFWDSWAPREPSPSIIRERGIMAPFMNTASVAPRDTCQIVLRNFDKTKRGKFLMSPVLHALRYFDNFQNVILIITADQTREGWLDRAREFCMEELQGNLGRAAWHSEVETFDDVNHSDGYLMFHPRKKASIQQGH